MDEDGLVSFWNVLLLYAMATTLSQGFESVNDSGEVFNDSFFLADKTAVVILRGVVTAFNDVSPELNKV